MASQAVALLYVGRSMFAAFAMATKKKKRLKWTLFHI